VPRDVRLRAPGELRTVPQGAVNARISGLRSTRGVMSLVTIVSIYREGGILKRMRARRSRR
jgi:hypothetical protein